MYRNCSPEKLDRSDQNEYPYYAFFSKPITFTVNSTQVSGVNPLILSRFSSLGKGIFRYVFDLKKCATWSALRNRRPQPRNFLIRCERGAAAFMASFGPFLLRFGVRVWVRVRVRGWVGFSLVR